LPRPRAVWSGRVVTIAGAGVTGGEVAGELHDDVRHHVRFYVSLIAPNRDVSGRSRNVSPSGNYITVRSILELL
jgi:hypothetical protein